MNKTYKDAAESCGYIATDQLVSEIERLHIESLNRRLVDRCFREWKGQVEDLDPKTILAAQAKGGACEVLLQHCGYHPDPNLVEILREAHKETLTQTLVCRAFAKIRGAEKKRKHSVATEKTEAAS